MTYSDIERRKTGAKEIDLCPNLQELRWEYDNIKNSGVFWELE